MSKVKYQHFVPRFYLEQFVNSKGRLWVYDKSLDKAYARKPDKAGGQKFFYDVPDLDEKVGISQFVEKFFQPFEGAAAAILAGWLAKLESRRYFRIYEDEKRVFALFLATQLLRTPNHRKFIMQMGATIQKICTQAHLDVARPELADIDFEVKWCKEAEPLFHAENIVDEDMLEHCASTLFNHIWIVAQNETDSTLYTSDHPIVRRPHKGGGWRSHSGYGSPGIELNFPLSPSYCLTLLERGYWQKFQRSDGKLSERAMNEENVQYNNSLQLDESSRFIYCRDEDFSLARQFCIEFPDVMDPDRPVVGIAN